ncbi:MULTISPECIES: GDP-mannose 4,6-dehydratase [unclassified Thalassospira]|uniref:GDP-mannose 4,6-dehydratase n=1 Tax=unclassified Thalassospira TaxID=2648997 RepID=UPI001AFF37BE|nr:GDP-mannose 4,6-dehydratase [Thalassospira sp.]MBO6769753.1 GDP-mannose 4,6-dehydratase [Thalassospira sp.]
MTEFLKKDFEGLRVLVTGGAGFIGSHLVDSLLEANCALVAVVDNLFLGKLENLEQAQNYGEKFRFYREDAAEFSALDAVMREVKPDVVFNLATKALLYSFFNPAGACRVNLDIALNLAELLRLERYQRLIHVSTSEVYGTAMTVPMSENHPLLAETTYAAGKAAADLALASYVNQYNLNITTVRPFNNYGPRQNDGQLAAIIPITAKRLMEGKPPIIQGDGLQTRDFVYVTDTVAGLMRFAISGDTTRGQIYNLASGRETTIKELVTQICRYFNYKGEIEWQPARSADVRRHLAGVDKARSAIGAVGTTALEQGLEQTLDWYRGRNSR